MSCVDSRRGGLKLGSQRQKVLKLCSSNFVTHGKRGTVGLSWPCPHEEAQNPPHFPESWVVRLMRSIVATPHDNWWIIFGAFFLKTTRSHRLISGFFRNTIIPFPVGSAALGPHPSEGVVRTEMRVGCWAIEPLESAVFFGIFTLHRFLKVKWQ